MQNKVWFITGAISDIGKATAIGLANMGANVVIIGRNEKQGENAQNEIKSKNGNPKVDLLIADLSSQVEIRKLAGEIQARYSALNGLINNAGIAPIKRSVTADGIERVFAVNYLAPFLLTNLLLERLKARSPARVVNVAGDFHRKATIQFDDLMSERDYNFFFASPEKGAETSIYLSSSPEVENVSGMYFIKKTQVASSPESSDEEIPHRLWKVSVELTSLVKS